MTEILKKWDKVIVFYLVKSKCVFATSHHSKMWASSIYCKWEWFFFFADMQYDEDDDEITPDLWQEACWIVIR